MGGGETKNEKMKQNEIIKLNKVKQNKMKQNKMKQNEKMNKEGEEQRDVDENDHKKVLRIWKDVKTVASFLLPGKSKQVLEMIAERLW